MSRVFANKAAICARLIRQAFPELLLQVGGDRTLNRCGKHLPLGKRLRADLPRDEHDPLVFPGAPPVDQLGETLKQEVASSPHLLTLSLCLWRTGGKESGS